MEKENKIESSKDKLAHKQTLRVMLRVLLKRVLFGTNVSTMSFRLRKTKFEELIRTLTFKKNERRSFIRFLNKNYPEFKISLLDVGARSGLLYPYIYLSYFKRFYLEGIEPDKKEVEAIMNSKKYGDYDKIHTVILSDKPGKIPLYITKMLGCTSIYKPNFQKVNYYTKSNYYKILKKIEVSATTLSELYENKMKFDFIALDVQGAEYNILKGGKEIFENAIGISLEANFSEMYENQPLFSDIHKLCSEKGFVLVRLDHGNLDGEITESGDCVYIKDHYFIKTKEDLFKRILFVLLWENKEYVEFLMRNHADRLLSKNEKNHILKILGIKIKKKYSTQDDGLSAKDYRGGEGYFS